ncbi:hypothetical protein L1987_33951 [Smallanthus sonchifolius]|uniref:Uncharacterized protein n=1 Tax=Smallanthus sonchifolius TaxID=185202 RepID=A0ACB9HT94_9ASTR|nr:hypothetical protein L1987_33951 [Smallanthus sonchifolius]
MLSHNIESKQVNKDEGQSMDGGGGRSNTPSLRPPEQILKCPRCDSSNTKFCYYNNYSLAQPRHFCKACRRYWTIGGALRNVPIGGTCRKSKKSKSYSSKCSSSDIGGMKFFGLSTLDFQLGGLNFPPRVSSSYGDTSSNHSLLNLDPLGYNLPFSSSHIVMKQGDIDHQQQHDNNQNGGFHEMGTSNHIHHNTNLASSIESLSSINQDLHWKLQQQRLAMLFGGGENDQQHQKEQVLESHHQKLQPILFQNLETAKPAQSSMATEWFFDNSYATENLNPATSTSSNGAGNDQNGSISNWNGIQAWNQVNQYSSVP